jgi:hypothetical protein
MMAAHDHGTTGCHESVNTIAQRHAGVRIDARERLIQ